MKYDANGKPVEDLAESYTFDKDTNTYTFKLRDGVKWHDGEDFNAEDVVYTYKELTEDETLGAASPATIRTLQVLRHRMIRL